MLFCKHQADLHVIRIPDKIKNS